MRGLRLLGGVTGLCLVLAGCSTGTSAPTQPPTLSASDRARFSTATFTEAGLRARYAHATHLSFSTAHGTQVAYTAPNGRVYLWYPGNQRVNVGDWKTIRNSSGHGMLCYRYSSASYNPVTRQHGGIWNCQRADTALALETEYTRGDPFALSSGRVPYVMPRQQRESFESLAARLGRSL